VFTLTTGQHEEVLEFHDRDLFALRLVAIRAGFLACEQRFAIVGRAEEPSAVAVLEVVGKDAVDHDRRLEPALAARRLVEVEESGADERVILEVAGGPAAAVLHGARQAAVAIAASEENIRGARGVNGVRVVAEG